MAMRIGRPGRALEDVKLMELADQGLEMLSMLPSEYGTVISLDRQASLFSVMHASEELYGRRKLSREKKERLEGMVLGAQIPRLQQEHVLREQQKGEERRRERHGLTEGPMKPAAGAKAARRGKDADLAISDFLEFAGNEKELGHLHEAFATADRFLEMKGWTGKTLQAGLRLYRYLFPNKDERESGRIIRDRIREMEKLAGGDAGVAGKYGDSRFHAMTATSRDSVLAYTQWSVMPVEKDGRKAVAVFWQYGGVADRKFMNDVYARDENPRERGINSAFFVLRHGIAAKDARAMGREGGVVGTILEAEFKGQADNDDDIRFTAKRLHIHRQTGAKAIIIETGDGRLLTAHYQPSLGPGQNPIMLHMLFRPLKFTEGQTKATTEMDKELAKSLVMSYIDNFHREGFDHGEVESARAILLERFAEARRVLLVPPEELPDIVEMARMDPHLRKQVEREYGSLDEHGERIRRALAAPERPGARRLGS
jgi:hypothetical protein